MFAQQWVDGKPSKKRGRDDDGDSDVAIGGTEGFTEHRNVRRPGRDSASSRTSTNTFPTAETPAVPTIPHIVCLQTPVLPH